MKNRTFILFGAAFIVFILFILLYETLGNYYRIPIEDTHTMSLNKDILINSENLDMLDKATLIIYLSEINENNDVSGNQFKKVNIVPADLLKRKNIRLYKKYSNSIIIVSANIPMATRAWVILSRKGFDNIKILDNNDNERLKVN
ncbi:hypothetical protein ACFLTE_05865 [Bacteroidota bacterium]